MNILLLAILLIYILGCGVTLNLIYLLEEMNKIRYQSKDKLYLTLGSWYSAVVLNSIVKND
jgi:hypothetical protein